MERYRSQEDYLEALERRSLLPEGFLCSTARIEFVPVEKQTPKPLQMNLSLIALEKDTAAFGGVFTKNRFPGAPVLIARERLGNRTIRGVLINNRISNVCAPNGRGDALRLLDALAKLCGGDGSSYLPASTGIIGWRLPGKEMESALPPLVSGLNSGSILPVAQAIMTTDSFPKVREAAVGEGRIVGVAKGAGMIEPNMGTMLAFLCTDVEVERDFLRETLCWCAERSFNRISIDGDQSTSDMAVLMSSRKRGKADREEFRNALLRVCKDLSEDIVRNGEGVGHVIRVRANGAPDMGFGLGLGKAIVNSPLVKTAIFGNDPNVGRLVGAIGDYLGSSEIEIDPSSIAISMGGIEVFSKGSFTLSAEKELALNSHMRESGIDTNLKGFPQHNCCVEISVELSSGNASIEVLGADLSYAYVRENADYRS